MKTKMNLARKKKTQLVKTDSELSDKDIKIAIITMLHKFKTVKDK